LVDGEDLWGRAAVDRLVDRLLACTDDAGLAAELEAFLSDQLRRPPAGSLASASATVDDWLERSAHLSLDRLMDQVGVGARHLRRLTLQTHGMSPKMLAMKYRALRAAASFVVSDTTDLEAEACFLFADQSHLTRDFRQFLGWTPGAFAGAPASLAAATLCGRRRAGATRPLVLLS
ncbi:MAG: helix-turn-helix domain-containing protein, partial [Caulobacteraceae bacterium]|nr:helix-turn-helix domain-containing protein [Caulobacteraceae bacterium]